MRPAEELRRRLLADGEEPDPRFSLANERTFLAWIRTALGLVAAGIVLHAVDAHRSESALGGWTAVVAVLGGSAVATAAWVRWLAVENSLRRRAPLPLPALGLGVVGLTLIVAVCALAATALE